MTARVAVVLNMIEELTAAELAELLTHFQEPPEATGVREPRRPLPTIDGVEEAKDAA